MLFEGARGFLENFCLCYVFPFSPFHVFCLFFCSFTCSCFSLLQFHMILSVSFPLPDVPVFSFSFLVPDLVFSVCQNGPSVLFIHQIGPWAFFELGPFCFFFLFSCFFVLSLGSALLCFFYFFVWAEALFVIIIITKKVIIKKAVIIVIIKGKRK